MNELKELGLLFVVLFLLISVIVGLAAPLSYYGCKSSAQQNEVEYRWSFLPGCSYKHPTTGLWVPKDNYRAVGD